MLKFHHDEVIIYDVRGYFRILFGMSNRLLMSYPCAKFHSDTPPPPGNYDTTIDDGDIWVALCMFKQNKRGREHNDAIFYDLIKFLEIFFNI